MAFEGLDFGILTRGVPQIDPVGSITRGMQLRELVQAKKDDQAMRELSQQAAGNLPQLADLAQQRGLYKQAGAIRKQHYDTQKEIATIQETLGKVDKQKRDAIFAGAEDMARMASWAKTPEDFNNGLIEIAKSHPILGGLQQGPDGVPMLPEKLQKYRVTSPEALESARALAIRNAMPVLEAMKTLAPKIEERSGAQVPVTTDVTGRQTVGAPVGFKAQDELTKVNQDLANNQMSPEDAFARRKMLREGKPLVQVNTGEQKSFTNETTLRKEYNDEIKGFRTVKDAYRRIQVAGQNDTAASDISLIYGYMKILDPGSVVREGEFATAQNAAGIPERIQAAYNKALTGERLAPSTKQDFLRQSQLIYEQALAGQQAVANRYKGIAEKYNLDPASVVTDEAIKQKVTMDEVRKAVKPGGKYAGKNLDEVVFALRKRGIEVQ